MLLIYILMGVIGLVFGSFFLVVATRLPEGKSIVKPGSHCDNCNHLLKWYELIPIVSYILQKGKCRKCGAHIPFVTLFVEIVCAALFMLSYYLYGFSYEFYAVIVLFSLTVIIFISDFKYYIISDGPLFVSIGLILVLKLIFFKYTAFLYALLSGLFMFTLFYAIKLFGDKLFKKESLGGGDIKLSILVGVTLGIKLGLAAFILSAFIALPYALYASNRSKKSEVPYGPFIIASLVIVFVFMKQSASILQFLFRY